MTTADTSQTLPVYVSERRWREERPHVLVIACSDGRLQDATDDFVHNHLNIVDYDRLYAPGGPGALASGGFEFLRADTFRRECAFLVKAHQLEQVILLFHGPAPNDSGPALAVCADYGRKQPAAEPDQIAAQQAGDAREIVRTAFGPYLDRLVIRVFRAEVLADQRVRFVDLTPG